MIKLRPNQEEPVRKAVEYFREDNPEPALIVMPTGCHAKGTLIPLYNGTFKKVEEIKIGDKLIGDDGKPREVVALHHGKDKLYEIIPSKGKGEPFIVNGGHVMSLYKTPEGHKREKEKARYDLITVEEYINTSKNYKHLHKLHRVKSIFFDNNAELPVDPYFLGLYLGDGSSIGTPSITTMREEIVKYIFKYAKQIGLTIRINWKGGNNKAKTYFLKNKKNEKNILTEKLRSLGLKKKTAQLKFIPAVYKTSTVENRLKLLAGLLDTDSYYDKDGNNFEYCTKSKQLNDDIIYLCRSLGICATTTNKTVGNKIYYRIKIVGELSKIPTKLEIRQGKNSKCDKTVTRFDVKEHGEGEYFGFTLNGNQLYCDGQFFIHHNSGKSILAAEVAAACPDPILVVQPTKELLEQNLNKYRLLCGELAPAGVYSASFGKREIDHVTFATIGSIKNAGEEFRQLGFRKMLIDEAHLYPRKERSMLGEFLRASGIRQVLGITATPLKLEQFSEKQGDRFDKWSELLMLTEPSPSGRFFKRIIHVSQVSEMTRLGYWSPLKYEILPFDKSALRLNTTGSEFSEDSEALAYILNNIRANIFGALDWHRDRRHCLVFVPTVEEARILASEYPESEYVCGETPKKERDRIISEFKEGRIRVLFNVMVVAVGFDYTKIDLIILAFSTTSVSKYFQVVGRGVRIDPEKKDCVVIDMGGNVERFGKAEDAYYKRGRDGRWRLYGTGGIILTGFPIPLLGTITREDICRMNTYPVDDITLTFGKHKGKRISDTPVSYRIWLMEKSRDSLFNHVRDSVCKSLENLVHDTRNDPPLAVLPDGKHSGEWMASVPRQYLSWYYNSKEWNETNDSLRRGLEIYLKNKKS